MLPDDLRTVLDSRAICFLTTLMPDGSPQVTQTWVGTDGEHIVINTVATHQKTRNIQADARVAVGLAHPDQPLRSWAVRGQVISVEPDATGEHINALSNKYLGRDYPGFGGGAQQRVVLTITVDHLHRPSR
ncbi:PPOX class F420-dependent oxidoreductase [Kineosporia rhizophila]|nr:MULTISPECIES: PPOX class F420-dependent oxidoreductase [Kineosporia]MCE0535504.1 PPOX class F420-dependent oxidoreductase [Kineosporia rhizophila]GLY16707.1 PPOX class F420-dependent enzyme [Kineosporia sp. NBRC 101677]